MMVEIRLAEALGTSDKVRFVGYLHRRDELPACYAAANAFVFASRTETQGLVVLEAMSMGLPVVALIFLRDQPNGFRLALWTLSIVWATDIGAYFAGRGFGGPKLAPKLFGGG